MTRQKEPKFSVALTQALKSVRHRPARQLASAFGIIIAVALLASVQSGRAAGPTNGGDATRITWLAYLSLLLCFTSITNSMLMSVTERFKEIGTLKCLGATNGFIVKLFFVESALIGFFASLAGAVLGIACISVIRISGGNMSSVSLILEDSPRVIGICLLVGSLLAITAAIIPSLQAAKMPAAAALRVEI